MNSGRAENQEQVDHGGVKIYTYIYIDVLGVTLGTLSLTQQAVDSARPVW